MRPTSWLCESRLMATADFCWRRSQADFSMVVAPPRVFSWRYCTNSSATPGSMLSHWLQESTSAMHASTVTICQRSRYTSHQSHIYTHSWLPFHWSTLHASRGLCLKETWKRMKGTGYRVPKIFQNRSCLKFLLCRVTWCTDPGEIWYGTANHWFTLMQTFSMVWCRDECENPQMFQILSICCFWQERQEKIWRGSTCHICSLAFKIPLVTGGGSITLGCAAVTTLANSKLSVSQSACYAHVDSCDADSATCLSSAAVRWVELAGTS